MSWVVTLVIVASLSLALKRERRDNMMNVAECVNVANTHFLNVNRVPSTPTDVVQMETKIMFELDWSFQLTPHCAAALWAEALGIDECGHFGEGEGELSLDIQQTLTRLEQTGEIPEQEDCCARRRFAYRSTDTHTAKRVLAKHGARARSCLRIYPQGAHPRLPVHFIGERVSDCGNSPKTLADASFARVRM